MTFWDYLHQHPFLGHLLVLFVLVIVDSTVDKIAKALQR